MSAIAPFGRATDRGSRRWVVTPRDLDGWLAVAALSLLALGWVMVTSASLSVAARELSEPWHYTGKQGVFALAGCAAAWLTVQVPIQRWQQMARPIMVVTLVVLALVLVPGFGRTVNGATRWLELGFIGFQVSEAAKLGLLIYLADYVVRKRSELVRHWGGFVRPLFVVGVCAYLLLLEPDFGAAVLLTATAMAVLFLGGVPLTRFALVLAGAIAATAALAVSTPYRFERITAFLDPWADPFDSGFQLTQSLIAIGSGGWTGVGLGASVQKLFYLPEAHTDFLFAIFAEEMGLLGVAVVVALFAIVVGRAFIIAHRADQAGRAFSALLAYGIGVWIALQAFINLGVNMGLLPTKGLTLPLMSYGGSSTLVLCVGIGLLLRIGYELDAGARQARHKEGRT